MSRQAYQTDENRYELALALLEYVHTPIDVGHLFCWIQYNATSLSSPNAEE